MSSLIQDPVLLLSIDDLEMTSRTTNCLKVERILTVGDLVRWSESDLLQTPNLGMKALREIKDVLEKYNLALSETGRVFTPEEVEARAEVMRQTEERQRQETLKRETWKAERKRRVEEKEARRNARLCDKPCRFLVCVEKDLWVGYNPEEEGILFTDFHFAENFYVVFPKGQYWISYDGECRLTAEISEKDYEGKPSTCGLKYKLLRQEYRMPDEFKNDPVGFLEEGCFEILERS